MFHQTAVALPRPLAGHELGFESHRLGEGGSALADEQGVRRAGDAPRYEYRVEHAPYRGDGPQAARRVHDAGVQLDGIAIDAQDGAAAGIEAPVVLHDDDGLDRRVEGVRAVTQPGGGCGSRRLAAVVERSRGARTAVYYDGCRHCISPAGRLARRNRHRIDQRPFADDRPAPAKSERRPLDYEPQGDADGGGRHRAGGGRRDAASAGGGGSRDRMGPAARRRDSARQPGGVAPTRDPRLDPRAWRRAEGPDHHAGG